MTTAYEWQTKINQSYVGKFMAAVGAHDKRISLFAKQAPDKENRNKDVYVI